METMYSLRFFVFYFICCCGSGADPGFPVGGGANRRGGGGGRQHTKLSNFPKNCMKLRKFRAMGGGGGRPLLPLNPPLWRIYGSIHICDF